MLGKIEVYYLYKKHIPNGKTTWHINHREKDAINPWENKQQDKN